MPPKPRPSRSDWENRKETIRQLYLDQDLTLQEVQRQMGEHGLVATRAQYETKFKEWGFSKNFPASTWKHVGFKIEKRKREGKDSTVSINGVEVPTKRVKREISRHYYSFIERAEVERNNAPSPQGPLTLVSTPPSQQEVLITDCWPPNIPWISFTRFMDIHLSRLPRMQLKPQTVHSGLHSPQKRTQTDHMLGRQYLLGALAGSQQFLCDTIGEFAPPHFDQTILPFSFNVEWLVEINPSMPLESTSSNHWGLKMLIYLAANKSLGIRGIDVTWRMIEQAGITQLAHVSSTAHLRDTSLAAAMECLFAAGIGAGHADLVSWLLDTGVNPDDRVKIPHDKDVHLPLIIALKDSYIYPTAEIVRLLLFHGASPVLVCCEDHGSPTQFLLQNFDHLNCFSTTEGPEILDAFSESATALNLGLRLQKQRISRYWNEPNANRSPLDQARNGCFHKMGYLVRLIEEYSARESDISVSLITPKSLIRAVERRSMQSIRLIHKHGQPVDCCDEQKRFPLQAAIEPSDVGRVQDRRNPSCVYLLLGLGASPDYNPSADIRGSCSPILHSAIMKCNFRFRMIEVIKNLIQGGAIVQGRPECGEIGHRTLMDCALSQDYSRVLALAPVINILHDAGLPLPQSALITILDLSYQSQFGQWNDFMYLQEKDYTDLCGKISSESPSSLFLRSERGWTALDYALSMRMHRLEALLVQNGVKLTRTFAYSQCDGLHCTDETVEELISRVPAPRSTKQSRDLLFYHLIGTIRAVSLKNRDSGRVSTLLRSYRMMPRSPKQDGYVLLTACLDADLTAMALELLPESYSSTAVGLIIEYEAQGSPSRPEITEELLRRRARASLNRIEDTWMVAMVVRKALGVRGDARLLKWFQKHDRKVLEYTNMCPSAFAIRVFGHWQSGIERDDLDITPWLKYGLQTSSYLGLLVAYSGDVQKMSALLHQGFQPNRRICWSLTALQLAVMRADRPMIRRLIEAGSDVNARPPWKDIPWEIRDYIPAEIRDTITSHPDQTHRRTALQLAVENGDISITKLLLDHGADVNGPAARVRGATALQLACIKGYIDIVRLLISKGADINAPGAKYFGRTALEGAAEHGRVDIACFLLEHNCQIAGSFRRQYIRAVGFARAQGHHVLSKLLQNLGRWTEEDEQLLKQTVLRDKLPGPHENEKHLSDEEISEVDPDECDSLYETFPYETDDENNSEDCDSVGEEGNATQFVVDDSHEATNGIDCLDQSIESAQTENRPWDEFIDYDADGEEEML